jgi:predicted ATP-binding protein involved in virulence
MQKFKFSALLKEVSINKFRGFDKKVTIELHPKLNIFVGDNGSGKTTILDAIAGLLMYIPNTAIKADIDAWRNTFNVLDINTNSKQFDNTAKISVSYIDFEEKEVTENSDDFQKFSGDKLWIKKHPKLNQKGELALIEYWGELQDYILEVTNNFFRNKTATGEQQFSTRIDENYINEEISFSESITKSIDAWLSNIEDNNKLSTSLPIFSYYSARRIDKPAQDNDEGVEVFDMFTSYRKNELRNASFNFKRLKQWLALQQILAWQNKGKSKGKDAQAVKVYETIKKAILETLNDGDNKVYTDISIHFSEFYKAGELVVQKGKTEIYESQFSSGERSIVALVADIARQLALANPNIENPLTEGTGIVLIDEVDLHLHPRWQRKIIQQLTTVFPNIQFIFTTHSPLILGEVKKGEGLIHILYNKEIYSLDKSTYGKESGFIMEDIMLVTERNDESKILLNKYFSLLANDKMEEAALVRAEIERIGLDDDPILKRADAMIFRKKIIGK